MTKGRSGKGTADYPGDANGGSKKKSVKSVVHFGPVLGSDSDWAVAANLGQNCAD